MTSSRTIGVVLTYRRPRLATRSVRYLIEDEGMDPGDIIVVVNGEGGLDDDELAESVHLLILDSNTGPAGGMRAGLLAAMDQPGAEWVYLCEDDIGVSGLPGCRIANIRALAQAYAETTGRPVGGVLAYSRRLDRRTGLTSPHIPEETGGGLVPTDVGSWGASLISLAALEAGVLPEADLFFGYEDFDFWLSMKSAGFEVLLDVACAQALGNSVHPGGREETLGRERSVDDAEPWRRYYEARNFLHLRRRHGRPSWTLAHLVKSVRRGMLGSRPHRRAILDGLVDGFRGRTGPHAEHLRSAQASEHTVARANGLSATEAAVPSFIVGCGRSGTTLLRAMLDSHPKIAVPPESYFVVALLKQRAAFEPSGTLDHSAFLDELCRAPSFIEWGIDRETLATHPAFLDARTVPEAITAAYRCYADRFDKSIMVDKTPFLGRNVGLLASSFPGTRFVHLVRDGRNVAQSLAAMEFGPATAELGILEWQRHVDAIDRYVADGGENVLCVRYEDLVEDPTAVLGRICRHIGVEFDPAMLGYTDRAAEVLAGIDRTAHLEGIRSAPTPDPRSWRTGLTPSELSLLEGLAGDTLERHGYERVTGPADARERVGMARARAVDAARAARLGLGARRARFLRARRLRARAAR